MDEVVDVLKDILNELHDMNSKLDDIRGSGLYSIEDIHSKLDDIQGTGAFNSISEIYDKIGEAASDIEFAINLK